MASTLSELRPPGGVRRGDPARTRVFALPEVRWAAVALLAFSAAVAVQFAGGPAALHGALYAACYVAGGWEPAWAGVRALRDRRLDVDLLMVVAAVGAASIGQVLDGGLLIVIFATSGALEAFATQRTADSVRGLLELAPQQVTRMGRDGREEVVGAEALAVGDVVLVRPGERIGADGVVVGGSSEVDQASVTGEPLPQGKTRGDRVFAGTVNGIGMLRVRVERPASDSMVARIATMVREASATKAATQLFVEKIEQRYCVCVVVATLALFFVPLVLGAAVVPTLLRAMTFMIVASPCAVVLATMPPLLSAIANAGRHGVLVRSAVVMERLGTVTRVAFDKTGTLTEGTPRLVEVWTAGADPDSTRLLTLAAAAECPSEHPLGRAVVSAARERGLRLPQADGFRGAPGRGVHAVVDGHRVEVGSPRHLLDTGNDRATGKVADRVAGFEAAGRTAVLVCVDGTPAGVLALADRCRPGAVDAVAGLAERTGRAPVLLTGDNAPAAAALAGEVGIPDVRAGLLPADKVAAVRRWQDQGQRVLVVGDGVNDAPALAAADVGVAMGHAGSDLTLDTADAVVVRDDLRTVPTVLGLARRARRLVIANVAIAGSFITVLVLWDLFGHLPLPLGVAGHESSTVIVGLNGLRLLRDAAWHRARTRETHEW